MSLKKKFHLDFQWPAEGPFLFCVHHHDFYPKGTPKLGPPEDELKGRDMGQDFTAKDGYRMYHGTVVPGFPVHPHRGFETITIVRKGYVDHADSLGAAGRYGQGDVQWVTAGSGVQHSEMFPLLKQDEENTLELFQIWLNLPRKGKMAPPHFTMFWNERIPKLKLDDDRVELTLIAGSYNEVTPPSPPPSSWASQPEGNVHIWLLRLEPGAEFEIPAGANKSVRTLYIFEGESLVINEDESVPAKTGVVLDGSQATKLSQAKGVVQILMLHAVPIEEPVVQYGPFVMTSEAEIRQTFEEYRKTQFGGWPWPSFDATHGSEIRRFAKYPDGRVEEPSQ